jgi:hypothetical protein
MFPVVYDEVLIRRVIFFRNMANLLLQESLEETFLHNFCLCLIFANKFNETSNDNYWSLTSGLVLLPLRFFLFATLPIQILGVVEWFGFSVYNMVKVGIRATKVLNKFVHQTYFYSLLVVFWVLSMCFINKRSIYFYHIFGYTSIFLSFIVHFTTLGDCFDKWIMPKSIKPKVTNLFELREKMKQIAVNSFCIIIVSEFLAYHFPLIKQRYFVLLIFILTLIDYFTVTIIIFTLHVVIVFSYPCVKKRENQKEIFLSCGVLILYNYNQPWFCSIITIIASSSFVICLMETSVQELPSIFLEQEREAQMFLAHAIKQKFASLGVTVFNLIEFTEIISPTLSIILNECRIGQDRCHAPNLAKRLEQGLYTSNIYFSSLMKELQNTATCLTLFHDSQIFYKDCISHVVEIELDWEIFHVWLTELAQRKIAILEITTTIFNPTQTFIPNNENFNGEISLNLNSCLLPNSNKIFLNTFSILTKCLPLRIIENKIILSTRIRIPNVIPSPIVKVENVSKVRNQLNVHDFFILSHLSYAVLDDNALIRKHLHHTLIKALNIPNECIILRGSCLEEVFQFAKEITTRNVDVAIIDQNLEYNNILYKGTDIAAEAKRLNFQNCLVIHSSDMNLHTLVQSSYFHGAVEKSIDSYKLLDGILKAYKRCKKAEC